MSFFQAPTFEPEVKPDESLSTVEVQVLTVNVSECFSLSLTSVGSKKKVPLPLVICRKKHIFLGGGFLKVFSFLPPKIGGFMIQNLTVAYFSDGLKLNHQTSFGEGLFVLRQSPCVLRTFPLCRCYPKIGQL